MASSEHPRARIRNRFVFIERQHAFDVAHQRPDEPPEQHGDSDDHTGQDYSDCKIQEPDPERANLKPAMRAQQRIRGGKLDMRNDDPDEGRRMQETPSTGGDYISNATHDRGSTSPQHQRAFPQLPPYGRDGANSPLALSAW